MPPEKPDGPAGRRRDYEARMLPAENKVAERLRSALAKGRQNPAQVQPRGAVVAGSNSRGGAQ